MIVSEHKMATTTKRIMLKPAPPAQTITSKGQLQTAQTITSKGQLQTGQQIIVLPSNFLQHIGNGTTTFKIGKPGLVTNVVSTPAVKRPSSVTSSVTSCDDMQEDQDGQPVRKRANLDHLTPEEKMMRRKLKNRVAAQNARDKKRTKMDEVEMKLKELEEANAKLLLENESLRALNERLLEEKCTTTPKLEYTTQEQEYTSLPEACPAPMTPPHSDCSSSERSASPDAMSSLSSVSDYSLVDSRPFESAELINASQQKSQGRGLAGLWTAVMATMAPAAFCLAASAGPSSCNPSQPTSQTLSSCSAVEDKSVATAPVLPLKKRQLQAVEETPPPPP